jgi:hypothetical protein
MPHLSTNPSAKQLPEACAAGVKRNHAATMHEYMIFMIVFAMRAKCIESRIGRH